MHLQDKNTKFNGQFLDIKGRNLFFTRNGELKLIDTNLLFNVTDRDQLKYFLAKLAHFEQYVEKL